MKAQASQHWDVYRNYTENQTEDLIYYRYKEQLSTAAATRKAGINERTARNMLKKILRPWWKEIACEKHNAKNRTKD